MGQRYIRHRLTDNFKYYVDLVRIAITTRSIYIVTCFFVKVQKAFDQCEIQEMRL